MREEITLIPYGDDPLAQLAHHLLEDYAEQLPDLTQAVVLLSEAHAATRLRHLLLEQAKKHGIQALLCPQIFNLRDWASIQLNKQQFNQNKTQTVCGQHQRELILFDALSQHKSILGSGSPWHLTDDLLKLFDQLTSNQKTLPVDYDEFEKEISNAYGVTEEKFSALGQEATLVHTLWNAWHSQLNAENVLDGEAAYILGLNADIQNNEIKLYIAGYHQFSLSELNWLNQLIKKNRCQLYLHGQYNSHLEPAEYNPDTSISNLINYFNVATEHAQNNTYTQFINNCYQNEQQAFIERTAKFNKISSDEINNQLKLLFCAGHEEQAHAVELQVRRWLLDGKTNIGIVTENRRLARRVRALLERADVPLQDLAGWALSTTRAGAVLERWLQCIEEDFAHQPFLDLLKSPFILSSIDSQQAKHAVYRLEHDIIRQENIARNLQRYQKAILNRAEKLQWSSETSGTLAEILKIFETANNVLAPLTSGSHEANKYIEALSSSLEIIGMSSLLEKDAAGVRVIEMLETLKHSANLYNLKFNWSDFRTWLGRSLEKFVFTPEKSSSPVTLMGLGQSRLQQFDALIIASAEHEHLPGKTNITPFFNSAVRLQLKIATTREMLTERFHHFRRLLEASPEILITANNEENGEEVPISPWLEIIHRFYEHTYSTSLEDKELKSLINNPNMFVIRSSDKSLPNKTSQASSSLPKELIPKQYSPSSYQTLMNCPYQFFATRGLNLSPNEEVQEALSKSDYGERVHLCLQAFHNNVEKLPGPFKDVISEKNRTSAINTLVEISQQVFARDLDDSFEHSGWLEQWLQLIPDYIDWQIKNATEWQFYEAELKTKISWHNHTELTGRLDRLDKNETGLSIIDYKTGKSSTLSEIQQGEAVQLPFYALLAQSELQQPVSQVSYLNLNKNVKFGAQLSDDALYTISHEIGERLSKLIDEMSDGKALTAWGNEDTCQYCNINRLCRKQAWDI